jgi:hypothetical protein
MLRCALYIRCALSIEKYGIFHICVARWYAGELNQLTSCHTHTHTDRAIIQTLAITVTDQQQQHEIHIINYINLEEKAMIKTTKQ